MTCVRVIATLGPATLPAPSGEAPGPGALRTAGADQARLNLSHLTPADLDRHVAQALQGGFTIDDLVADLQGGKTRLGPLPHPIRVEPGRVLTLGDDLPLDRPGLVRCLCPGDRLRVDDGRVTLTVLDVRGPVARVQAEDAGTLAARKGVSLVGRVPDDPSLGTLLPSDLALLERCLHLGMRRFAVSYAHVPGLLDRVRNRVGSASEVVAKVEHPAAFEALHALACSADTLWLCRGDLGAEVGLAELPRFQRRILSALPAVPLLVAGQVLHHLTTHPRPTRSEVCHVWDLLAAGVAGFVLSDETAEGPNGPAAVRCIREVEESWTRP